MPILTKNKVQLTFEMESSCVIAGDAVIGAVQANVIEDIDCTAIRLRVRCLERGNVMYYNGQNTDHAIDEFVHFEKTLTFVGRERGDSSKGRCHVKAGSYSYPFHVQLPPSIPPTMYHKTQGGSGEYRISLVLRAYVDVPHGLDRKLKQEVTVLPSIPEYLYYQTRNSPGTPLESQSVLYSSTCCCCHCGKHKGSSATLTVSPYPAVLVATAQGKDEPPCDHVFEPSNDFFNVAPPNNHTVKLLVKVSNESAAGGPPITEIYGVLYQTVALRVKGHSHSESKELVRVSVDLDDGPILPGRSREVALLLEVPCTEPVYNICSITGVFGAASCRLVVGTGGKAIMKKNIDTTTVMSITAALDASNRVPPPFFQFCRDCSGDV